MEEMKRKGAHTIKDISRRTDKPIRTILLIYLLCFVFRGIEYLFIRTDQSIFGEAFLHKLIGIAILFAALRYFSITATEIGFQSKNILLHTAYGLLLGISVFTLAYSTDYIIQAMSGNAPFLKLYVTSYSVDGNLGNQTSLLFFLICILGNIINVVMEEGIFRGLFLKLAERKYSFAAAIILSSVLFGLWHIAAPLRGFLDGERSLPGTLMMMLMLTPTTFLGGVKFCLLSRISGALWLPMADHFVNNTIINLLHVVTAAGADTMQAGRITIAQTISTLIVLILFLRYKKKNAQ